LSLSSCCASLLKYCIQIDRLLVLLQSGAIIASKCICRHARSQPPRVSLNSHDYSLEVRTITASKCIFKLARSQSPSASPNRLDYSLQVYLQTPAMMVFVCISQPSRSRCGEMVKLEARQPIKTTLPHLVWHPIGIYEKERF
jgi:hypothetical protein